MVSSMGISLHLGGFRVWMGVCTNGWQIGYRTEGKWGEWVKG